MFIVNIGLFLVIMLKKIFNALETQYLNARQFSTFLKTVEENIMIFRNIFLRIMICSSYVFIKIKTNHFYTDIIKGQKIYIG